MPFWVELFFILWWLNWRVLPAFLTRSSHKCLLTFKDPPFVPQLCVPDTTFSSLAHQNHETWKKSLQQSRKKVFCGLIVAYSSSHTLPYTSQCGHSKSYAAIWWHQILCRFQRDASRKEKADVSSMLETPVGTRFKDKIPTFQNRNP